MSARPEPVRRTHLVPRATPMEVFAVVVDFPSYPRLFPELTGVRIIETAGPRTRVEFRAQVVLPVRYVLDLVCDGQAGTVDWTYVEGEVVSDSVGGWRLRAEGDGTRVDYFISLDVKAPLPGFVLRKVIDGLVSVSLPGMLKALDREVLARAGSARSP